MSQSALIGDPPVSQTDSWIINGFLVSNGLPPMDTSQGLQIPPPRPPNAPDGSRAASTIASLAVATFFVVIVTAGRVIARWKFKSSRLGWDDFFIILSCLVTVSWFGLAIAMIPLAGVGKHIYDCTYENLYWFWRIANVDLIVFFVAVSFAKLSIICFNWRLTGETSKVWQWVHKVFFFVVSSYLLVCIFWANFRCNPPAASESLIIAGQHADTMSCLSLNVMGLVLSSLHIGFDWILLSIPVVLLIRTRMSLAKKLRCIIPLSIGALSCVGSVMRLYYQLKPMPDLTWAFPVQLHWTVLDLVCATIVTSLPALNSVLTRHLPSALQKYWGKSQEDTDEFGHHRSGPDDPSRESAMPSTRSRSSGWNMVVPGKDGRPTKIDKVLTDCYSIHQTTATDESTVASDSIKDESRTGSMRKGDEDSHSHSQAVEEKDNAMEHFYDPSSPIHDHPPRPL